MGKKQALKKAKPVVREELPAPVREPLDATPAPEEVTALAPRSEKPLCLDALLPEWDTGAVEQACIRITRRKPSKL